jgi:hypothetical protein
MTAEIESSACACDQKFHLGERYFPRAGMDELPIAKHDPVEIASLITLAGRQVFSLSEQTLSWTIRDGLAVLRELPKLFHRNLVNGLQMFFRRWKKLTPARTLVTDIVTIANRMPLAPLLREFDLPELDQLRRQVRPRLSWTVLMMKAYAIVAKRHPELRQIFMRRPFAHIYEHPQNIAQVTITREVAGETRLFFARFHRPEETSLIKLQQQYEFVRRAPLDEVKQFQHQITFARVPAILRKPLWWLLTDWWGSKRALYMGTFGMSISCFREVLGVLHLGPSTTTVGYDMFPRKGKTRITLTFDHRILDGKPAVDILEALYQTISTEITAEVRRLASKASQADTESLQLEEEESVSLPQVDKKTAIVSVRELPLRKKAV